MLSLRAKVTLSAFYWNMGAVFKIFSFKKISIVFCRIDPKLATDEKEKTPLKIALDRDNTEIVFLLSEAIGEEVPDKVKLEQLSKAMYKEDKEEGRKRFTELLGYLTPEKVRVFTL